MDEEDIGGDPVCWAQFVCSECGAMTTEGHREGCSAATSPADTRTDPPRPA